MVNPLQNPNLKTNPQTAAASTVTNKPPVNAFVGLPYSSGGTPTNPKTLPNTSGVYSNPNGGSTRVISGGGVSSDPGKYTGVMGAINSFGRNMGLGINEFFGTNFGNHTDPDPSMSKPITSTTKIPTDVAAPKKPALVSAYSTENSGGGSGSGSGTGSGSSTTLTPQQQFDQNQAKGLDVNGNATSQYNTISNYANTQNPDLRQQVINSQAQIAPNAQKNLQTAQDNLVNFQKRYATEMQGVDEVGGDLNSATGQQGIINNKYAQELPAYQSAVSTAQTALGQGVTANSNVIGATQPVLGNIGSQQFYSPPTSAMGGSTQGSGTLPQSAQDFVNSLAQQVQSGQMTRSDAESRLSTYGVSGLQALNTALGSGFNTNASNSSAATTGIGQQLKAAIPPANQALDALQTAFSGLGSFSGSDIPLVQELSQNLAMQTGIGRDKVSAFQGALNEARSRVDAALAGSIGVDAAGKQANALLPDNMKPSEIPTKIAAAKQYLQNQLQSYTQSGNQNGGGTTGGTVQTSVGTINPNF